VCCGSKGCIQDCATCQDGLKLSLSAIVDDRATTTEKRDDDAVAAKPNAAFADRLKGKLEPTKGGSVYVDPESMEWQKSQFDKIWMKVLYRNDAARRDDPSSCAGSRAPRSPSTGIPRSSRASSSKARSHHDGICRAASTSTAIPARSTRPFDRAACCWRSIASRTCSSHRRFRIPRLIGAGMRAVVPLAERIVLSERDAARSWSSWRTAQTDRGAPRRGPAPGYRKCRDGEGREASLRPRGADLTAGRGAYPPYRLMEAMRDPAELRVLGIDQDVVLMRATRLGTKSSSERFAFCHAAPYSSTPRRRSRPIPGDAPASPSRKRGRSAG